MADEQRVDAGLYEHGWHEDGGEAICDVCDSSADDLAEMDDSILVGGTGTFRCILWSTLVCSGASELYTLYPY